MSSKFTKIALAAGILLALAFTSCASKPQASNQEELELRAKKGEMMKRMEADTADHESK